jgi:hypothetical protein
MHTEDTFDDTDLAKPSVSPLCRSRAQQLPVSLTVNISDVPEGSAPVALTSLPPLPQISIFDESFSSMTETELATTFLNHNVVFVLPLQYKPHTFGLPESDMIVVGTRYKKLKSVLWVRFISPQLQE